MPSIGFYRNYGKTFKKPRRPFEKERLDAELKVVGEFGLRNKRELWRVQMVLSKLRARARDLLTLDEKDPKCVRAWGAAAAAACVGGMPWGTGGIKMAAAAWVWRVAWLLPRAAVGAAVSVGAAAAPPIPPVARHSPPPAGPPPPPPPPPPRLFEGEALMRRMYRYGFLDESQTKLDYVLALTPAEVLERRLQTLVFKLGLAKSIHHARVLIRQRHIRVGKQIVNVPSFMVRIDSQVGSGCWVWVP